VQEQAVLDLVEDLADLEALCRDQVDRLDERMVDLERPGSGVPGAVRVEHAALAAQLIEQYADDAKALRRLRGCPLEEMADGRRFVAERVRARQGLTAAVLVASDWHSPSISHSTGSQAGRQEGRVTAHTDDYKRDRHPEAADFERRWVAEMVDDVVGHRPRAVVTSSGMAAVITALTALVGMAGAGPVLLGRSTYHETRELVQTGPLRDRVRLVAEEDVAAWAREPAAAVIVDSRGNSATMPAVDVRGLLEALDRSGRATVALIDTTGSSVSLQPWPWLRRGSAVRLVVVESLTKYAQHGLDRTAAGVLVASEPLADLLDDLREHLGTNIADVAVEQLPRPHRARLERRLARIERNAGVLGAALATRISDQRLPLRLAQPRGGGLIALSAPEHLPTTDLLARLVKEAVVLAAERGVILAEGSSFGFDTTRLYLTATTTRYGAPFLRVAAGTEHAGAIGGVAAVLADALEAAR
jgi:cystathionine beta-lyase/cystathionine gamma-synthase